MSGKSVMRKVADLVLLPQKTFRKVLSAETVAEYAGLMERGVEFPPITVAKVGKAGAEVLVGGAHRLAAATKAKIAEISTIVVEVKTATDAEVLAFTDNGAHGLNLTAEERRQAIIGLLQSGTFKKLSNVAAAKRLGVSDMSIKRYRDAIGTKSPKAVHNGHKETAPAKGKSKVEPEIDRGGEVKPQAGKPNAAWNIREGGSWSGGGAQFIVDAIVDRVTEGVGRKSVTTWNERCKYLKGIGEALVKWADANEQK